jgi:hypothetical protein
LSQLNPHTHVLRRFSRRHEAPHFRFVSENSTGLIIPFIFVRFVVVCPL